MPEPEPEREPTPAEKAAATEKAAAEAAAAEAEKVAAAEQVWLPPLSFIRLRSVLCVHSKHFEMRSHTHLQQKEKHKAKEEKRIAKVKKAEAAAARRSAAAKAAADAGTASDNITSMSGAAEVSKYLASTDVDELCVHMPPLLPAHCALLAAAVSRLGHQRSRHRGTQGHRDTRCAVATQTAFLLHVRVRGPVLGPPLSLREPVHSPVPCF